MAAPAAILWDSIEGDEYLDEVVLVDQSPIGRTPRSNPVTYIKAFDIIRELFASLPEAKKRGFPAGHFSFNVPGGRCENCQGDGTVTVEMQFLADVELICDECKGTRYKPQVLEIHYKGKNIHEVLNLTIREALKFFADVPRLTEKLRVLDEVGLGYLRLGQSATTLSGGEAQRMKLAAHLQPRNAPGQPPRGGRRRTQTQAPHALHFRRAHHRPALRRRQQTTFRFPPSNRCGRLDRRHRAQSRSHQDGGLGHRPRPRRRRSRREAWSASGPPEAIAELENSYTGQYLKQVLNGNGARQGGNDAIESASGIQRGMRGGL